MFLEKMTTSQAKEVFNNNPVVIIPVGSIEQHGNHCALGTDYIIPKYMAGKIGDREDIIVVPAIPYGVCPYHTSFEGSIDIGYEGLLGVIRGITSSLMKQGLKKFIFLNGHGGNTAAIDKASLEVYNQDGICANIDWWSLVSQLDSKFVGGHGDILETSAMMSIDKNYVDLSLVEDMNPINPTENLRAQYIQAVQFKGGVIKIIRNTEEIAPSGWFGPVDPINSNSELGREALDCAINFVDEFIDEFKKM